MDVVAAGVRSLQTGALTQSLVSVVMRRMERRGPVLPLYREVGDVSSKISGRITWWNFRHGAKLSRSHVHRTLWWSQF